MNDHIEDLLNNEADEKLNEEVAQKEILDYLQEKYEVNYLVSQRTIQRWLQLLGIDCIQPRPNKNSDIRYRKEDILKLEEMKRRELLKKRNKELKREQVDSIGANLKENYLKESRNYYENQANMSFEERRQEEKEHMLDYSFQATSQIEKDMLEMCFKKLFQDTRFDKELLEKILAILHNPDMFSEEEVGNAFIDLNEKAYIKNIKQ